MHKSAGNKPKVKCPSNKFTQENVKDEFILNKNINGVLNGLSAEEKFSKKNEKQKQLLGKNCQILDEKPVNGLDKDPLECNKQVKHIKKKKIKLKEFQKLSTENIVQENSDNESYMVQNDSEKLLINDASASSSRVDSIISPVENTNCSTKEILDVVESLVSMQLEVTNRTGSYGSTIEQCVQFKQYESEMQMPMIMRIIQKDLSEPYSIYTYRYFIHNWPKLCYLAMCEDKCVGAIVCKLDTHRKVIKRGYIAMLAVDKNYRKKRIGSKLVELAIEEMIRGDADEVVLETEVTNKSALQLYEKLGFVRDKRLFRYYLNGVDALRLKLWLR